MDFKLTTYQNTTRIIYQRTMRNKEGVLEKQNFDKTYTV